MTGQFNSTTSVRARTGRGWFDIRERSRDVADAPCLDIKGETGKWVSDTWCPRYAIDCVYARRRCISFPGVHWEVDLLTGMASAHILTMYIGVYCVHSVQCTVYNVDSVLSVHHTAYTVPPYDVRSKWYAVHCTKLYGWILNTAYNESIHYTTGIQIVRNV